MRFQFDERRAAQAAAVLLRLAGGRENYTWLLKVLYLADREALKETGAPIAGATFCNMRNGPLASDVYDCIKEDAGRHPVWNQFITKEEYNVRLVKDAGDSELSDFDVELLTNMYGRYARYTFRGMIDVVHGLPEWHDPGATSETLPPEQILRCSGVDDERVADIDSLNGHVSSVANLLSI